MKELTLSTQVAPFVHGLEAQSSMSKSWKILGLQMIYTMLVIYIYIYIYIYYSIINTIHMFNFVFSEEHM